MYHSHLCFNIYKREFHIDLSKFRLSVRTKVFVTETSCNLWTASSPQIAEMLRPYRDYTMICCGVVNDALAVHVLEHRDAVLARNRPLVMGNLAIAQAWIDDEPRVSWVAPQGVSTSCIKLDIPEDDEAFCLRLLEDEGVLLVPGSRSEEHTSELQSRI